MMKRIHSMSKGETTVNNFWFIQSVYGFFFSLGVDTLHQMFFNISTFLQKGWQIQKASCPRGQHESYTNLYPCSGRLQNGIKELKVILHFFLLCKDQWCHLHPCSQWPGVGCLWFAQCFPQSPVLLPGISSCLPTNKKCCTPNHGGEGFVTSTWTLPGIQH